MILDALQHDVNLHRSATVVIVGAGPAASVLAKELAKVAEVLVVEAGASENDQNNDWLLEGESVGYDYPLRAVRGRQLGGTSALWAGYCVEFDDQDFAVRPYIPLSGWPFGLGELAQYRHRVAHTLGLSSADCFRTRYRSSNIAEAFDEDTLEISNWIFAPSTRRFADDFSRFPALDNPTTIVNAVAVELILNSDHTRLRELVLRTSNGREGRIRAEHTILACGGIETPRLLLASNNQVPAGVGNTNDMVGRCFVEHPHRPMQSVELKNAVLFEQSANRQPANGCDYMLNFGLPNEVQARLGVLNARAHAYRTAAMNDAAPPVLGVMMEQRPNPESRITLSAKTDAVGMRLARLNWQLTPLDHQSFVTTAKLVAAEIERCGLGRIIGEEVLTAPVGYCCHQLGTTRMSLEPREGVTDKDCRVHNIENLYIAGGSVFPTGSWANPTFTILSLAYRQAEMLKVMLGGQKNSR